MSGFGGFNSFGSSDPKSNIDTLLALAQARGGSVSEAVNEMVHPQTSILSTIGDGFKNSFKAFVDVISVPSQIVAGVISADKTIGQAIDENISPSDVIFGDRDPDATTLQKVGGFTVRNAVDVLLDPLTYVTFGASSGSLFGARAASKITLGEDTVKTLTKQGTQDLNYLRLVERQQKGLQSFLTLGGKDALTTLPERLRTFKEIKALEKSGVVTKDVIDMSREEVAKVLGDTINAPLDREFAKNALANMITKSPALTETLIDKGGVKFFGQTILSGQRIHSVSQMIPGMTLLDAKTEQLRMAIGGLFDPAIQKGLDGKYVRLPPEFMDFQRKIVDLAGDMKEQRVRNMSNIIKANGLSSDEGKYLLAAVEAGKLPADSRLANAYKQLMGFNEKEFNFLRESGVRISRLDNHVPHILVDNKVKLLPFKMPVTSKVGAAIQRDIKGTIFKADTESLQKFEQAVLSKNKQLIDSTVEELKNTGFEIFDDNILSASVVRSIDNVRAGTMRQFVESLAKNYGKVGDAAPGGYVGINMKAIKDKEAQLIGQGIVENELKFHPAIAKRIEEFTDAMYKDGATEDFLKAYDKLQNFWMASVTSIFLAFHGRNGISNVFLNYNDIGLESLNPATHYMTFQLFQNNFKLNGLYKDLAKGKAGAADEIHDIMTQHMFTDASGFKWTHGELASVMKQNNIALRDDIIGQIDTAKTSEEMINGIMPGSILKNLTSDANPFSNNFKPFEWGRAVGNVVEGNARMINFITNLKKTGDVGLATSRTKQFLFDYQYLTPFERGVMKRIIPFYSFIRKNIEAQASTLLTAPGRTAAQITALTTLGDTIAGAKLTEEEKKALPAWVTQGISILKNRNGQSVEVYQSLGSPLEAVFQQAHANSILSSVSPILRLPTELASGYNFFTGKPLNEVTNAAAFKNAPQPLKDFIGYTDYSFTNPKTGKVVELQVALRPERMHLILNLPPTSRVISALKQLEAQDVSTQSKALQQLVGLRPFAFDLDIEAAKRDKEMQKNIERVLSSAGIGYEYSKFVAQDQADGGVKKFK